MPIIQPDPWKNQFFEHVNCPDDTFIPTKDVDAFRLNPQYNWAYNKLVIFEKQLIPCGPHGTIPPFYPVFSKPIYNLRSMGAGIEVFHNLSQYQDSMKPGYMWSELLIGDHYSTDVAVLNGKVIWLCHAKGYPAGGGTFDYWELKQDTSFDSYVITFIESHFVTYTGMLNLETIGGKIIEVHLRFTSQWPDLYGNWFAQSLVDLYHNRHFPIGQISKVGYSVVLFDKPRYYKKPEQIYIDNLLKTEGISSIQLPFRENVCPTFPSMPPGSFRIAIINGFNLEACNHIREELKSMILPT